MPARKRAVLLTQGGPDDGKAIGLPDGVTLVGLARMNDIVVDRPGVSRQHASIRGDRYGYWLQDLGSKLGTFINGERVEGEGQRLGDKDRIELGGTENAVSWVFREEAATEDLRRPSRQ